jgi:hypothetical protein
VETPNDAGGGDGGGENQQMNGEAQDQCVSQDAEMEEGNNSNIRGFVGILYFKFM